MNALRVFMSDSPAQRLKRLREKRFETAADAAKAFGWNEVTYRSHESGTRNIPVEAARKYAMAFASTPGHILGIGGDGTIANNVNPVSSVPLVGRISAGVFRFEEEGAFPDIMIPAIQRPGISANSQYAVLVDGPSVNLKIPDGAYAICAQYDSVPGGAQHGQLVHVVRERAGLFEHTIKELHYTRSGMVLMPASNDPRFQEKITLDDDGAVDEVLIKGIVIGAFQPF